MARSDRRKARCFRHSIPNRYVYTDGRITVVHVEHFKSQGALLPQWLGEQEHPRARLGVLAKEAVASSGVELR